MNARTMCLSLLVFVALVLPASHVWALGLELSESKEQLKLKYEVSLVDHGTGRVTIHVTIADEGRLKPLQNIELAVPGQDGTGYYDLVVSLETRDANGKQSVRAHLSKELAERGSIRLITRTLDGKQSPATWYFHRIPIAEYIKDK